MFLLLATFAHALDRDHDGYPTESDCNDLNAAIFPGAAEACNGKDDDCDGTIDDGAPGVPWYRDADRDGYGRSYRPAISCSRPVGHVANATDCNDLDASISPGAVEACDGIDQDCDGTVDDGWTYSNYYTDADHDGYGDPSSTPLYWCYYGVGYSTDATDCDDGTADANPAHPETCDDGFDNDCDGEVDECAPTLVTETLTDADATITTTSDTYAGLGSVAFGDFDGDGDDDLVAGDTYSNAGATGFRGNAAVWLSPPSGAVDFFDADVVLSHSSAAVGLGGLVGTVGDVTGDGVDDLAVGAPYDNTGASGAGAVYLFASPFTAGADLDSADALATFTGESASDAFASRIRPVGDLDGDGFGDVAFADRDAAAASRAGSVYVWYGPVSGTLSAGSAEARLRGETTGNDAGCDYTGLGDTDGDGIDDLAVGASLNAGGGTQAGAVYILTSPRSGGSRLTTSDGKWTGAAAYAQAGWSVVGPGDIDGDGYTDMAVTSVNVTTYASTVSIVHGPLDRTASLSTADATITTGASGDGFGWTLADGGDANGDGEWDLWASLSQVDSYSGQAWLMAGPFAGNVLAEEQLLWTLASETANAYAGTDLAAGDVDGDGVPDPVITTAGYYVDTEGYLFLSSTR